MTNCSRRRSLGDTEPETPQDTQPCAGSLFGGGQYAEARHSAALSRRRMALLTLLSRPFLAYNRGLERSPLAVKSVTSGVMYAAGDLLAQLGEHYEANKSSGKESRKFKVNWRRLAVLWAFGTVVSGPAMHYWFSYLDTLPGKLFLLRQHRQKLKILRAYATLKRHNIKVELDLDKLPTAAKSRPWLDKASKIGAHQWGGSEHVCSPARVLQYLFSVHLCVPWSIPPDGVRTAAADQLIFSSLYTLVFFLSVGVTNGAIDKLEADAKAEHIAEVQGLLANRYTKPERQLEADLHRLKTRVAARGSRDDAYGDLASIEAVLALLGEEKRKARLTWPDVWHATWAHTKSVFWTTYAADWCVGFGSQVGCCVNGRRHVERCYSHCALD